MNHNSMDRAYRYYLAACTLLECKNASEALELFQKSLALDKHFKTLEKISLCHQQLGSIDLALEYIESAFNANPRNNKTAYIFAEQLKRNGNTAKAKEVLQFILKVNPSYKKAKMLLNEIGILSRASTVIGSDSP